MKYNETCSRAIPAPQTETSPGQHALVVSGHMGRIWKKASSEHLSGRTCITHTHSICGQVWERDTSPGAATRRHRDTSCKPDDTGTQGRKPYIRAGASSERTFYAVAGPSLSSGSMLLRMGERQIPPVVVRVPGTAEACRTGPILYAHIDGMRVHRTGTKRMTRRHSRSLTARHRSSRPDRSDCPPCIPLCHV